MTLAAWSSRAKAVLTALHIGECGWRAAFAGAGIPACVRPVFDISTALAATLSGNACLTSDQSTLVRGGSSSAAPVGQVATYKLTESGDLRRKFRLQSAPQFGVHGRSGLLEGVEVSQALAQRVTKSARQECST